MMFFVGNISWPPTIGFFCAVTSAVAAMTAAAVNRRVFMSRSFDGRESHDSLSSAFYGASARADVENPQPSCVDARLARTLLYPCAIVLRLCTQIWTD